MVTDNENENPPSGGEENLRSPEFVSRQVESSRMFWFDHETVGGPAFRVVGGGHEICRPDYRIDRRTFPWLCFEFVAAGRGAVELAGHRQNLRAGSFFFYGPGIEHHISSDARAPLKKYFMVVDGVPMWELLGRVGLEVGAMSESTRPQPMQRALDELIIRGSRRSRWAHELCVALATQVLIMAREDAMAAGLADTRAYGTYSRVKALIEEQFLEVTTLDAVATACGLDAAYLCRLFSRFQDETPYQLLTRLRMEYAARRMIEGGHPVKAVAAELGFSDPFHFSRVFKSIHRVPPSRFRGGRDDKLGAGISDSIDAHHPM